MVRQLESKKPCTERFGDAVHGVHGFKTKASSRSSKLNASISTQQIGVDSGADATGNRSRDKPHPHVVSGWKYCSGYGSVQHDEAQRLLDTQRHTTLVVLDIELSVSAWYQRGTNSNREPNHLSPIAAGGEGIGRNTPDVVITNTISNGHLVPCDALGALSKGGRTR